MRKLLNKKGTVGLDKGKAVMLSLFVLGILAFAVIVVMTELNSSHPEPGSTSANQSANVLNNITGGIESFFSNAGTWFALLAVVILILIVVIVIKAVSATDKGGL